MEAHKDPGLDTDKEEILRSDTEEDLGDEKHISKNIASSFQSWGSLYQLTTASSLAESCGGEKKEKRQALQNIRSYIESIIDTPTTEFDFNKFKALFENLAKCNVLLDLMGPFECGKEIHLFLNGAIEFSIFCLESNVLQPETKDEDVIKQTVKNFHQEVSRRKEEFFSIAASVEFHPNKLDIIEACHQAILVWKNSGYNNDSIARLAKDLDSAFYTRLFFALLIVTAIGLAILTHGATLSLLTSIFSYTGSGVIGSIGTLGLFKYTEPLAKTMYEMKHAINSP